MLSVRQLPITERDHVGLIAGHGFPSLFKRADLDRRNLRAKLASDSSLEGTTFEPLVPACFAWWVAAAARTVQPYARPLRYVNSQEMEPTVRGLLYLAAGFRP